MTGTVKSFNKQKGYGFISVEGKEDIFFHYSSLQMEGFKTVEVGQKVEFDLEESDKGLKAKNVKVVG